MEDIFLQSQTVWFLIGLVLILLELVVPGLVLVFFGIGAWVTAIVCFVFDISVNIQLLIFLTSSITSLVLLRRAVKKRYMDKKSTGGGLKDEYVGHIAVALTSFNSGEMGKVSFKGSNWEATTNQSITEGQQLRITGYESIRLMVEPLQ